MFKIVIAVFCIGSFVGQVEPRLAARVNLVQEGSTYSGKIHVNGDSYHVNLAAPVESAFSSNFKFLLAEEGPNGEPMERDVTPTPEQLYDWERHMYVDSKANAAFRIDHSQEGEIRLHGAINNIHLSHDGESHYAIMHDNAPTDNLRIPDYVILNETRGRSHDSPVVESRQATTANAEPEIYFVVDNKQYMNLGSNTQNVTQYLSQMCRMINNRYAAITNPSIKFKVVGVLSIAQRSQQPFMENNKCGSSAYDMGGVLNAFATYMYDRQNTAHDLSPLLSGEEWASKNSDGSCSKGIAGLAWVGGACWADSKRKFSYKTSVNADQDAIWRGSMTITHELAHNLNCFHDGDNNTASQSCPWDDGYIMSYKGWGTENKFYFSSCCRNAMQDFTKSDSGSCLKRTEGATAWSQASKDAGDMYSLDEQCKRVLKRSDSSVKAVQDPNKPNDICLNLKCQYNAQCSDTDKRTCVWTWTTNSLPYDNSPCGDASAGTKCWNGKCVKR